MQIQAVLPSGAARGRERWQRVEITPDGSRLRYVFRYMQDDEAGLECAEFSIEQAVADTRELEAKEPGEVPVVTPALVNEAARRFGEYERIARATLAAQLGLPGAGGRKTLTTRARAGQRTLSDGFLRKVVASHARYLEEGVSSATGAVAHEYGSSPRTVRYWLQQARKRGLITEED